MGSFSGFCEDANAVNELVLQLVDMIASVDVDGTGHIDEAEFINMMTKKLRDCSKSCLLAQELQLEHTQTKLLFEHAEPHSELQETFDYFDADKDSKISAADLCKAATKLGMDVTEAEAETMLEEGSAETGGTFRFETLHKLMEASIPEKEQVKLRNEFQESKHNDEEEETKAGENE